MNEEIKEGTNTIEPKPFGVTFTWKDKSISVTLKNGEDLLRVAQMLSSLLTAYGIQNELEEKSV